MPRTYHKENCSSCVRAVITDKAGNRITLMGQHAFNWSIVKEKDGKIIITSFPNRVEATKEFNKYRRKR